jgi:predicted negative regulator of RcsB-dependent stress response
MVEDYSDKEQEEALRSWLSENWRWMLGGVALGVAMLVGWNYWGSYREERAAKAAVLTADVRKAIDANDVDKASKLVVDLTRQYGATPYAQEARLQLARIQVAAGKYEEAVALLRAVADESKDEELRRVAQLRQARVLVQLGKHDQALALLKPDEGGEFSAAVNEVRGDALFAKGDQEGARAAYAAALGVADAAVDRQLVELKLQEAGGTPPTAATSEGKSADGKSADTESGEGKVTEKVQP